MKSILKTLIPVLLIGIGLHGTSALAQAPVICNTATAAACSTGVNPGDGTEGDAAWVAFGKINANFDAIPSQLFSGLALPIVDGGTGQQTASAAINALLPSQSGMSGDCLSTNGSVASWISSCGGGSSAFSAITNGTNTSATMVCGTGCSLATSGSGLITANAIVSGTALGTPSSIVLTGGSALPLTTGVTGLLPVANGGTATATPSLVAGTNVTITGTWPNQTVTASSTASTAFSALTGSTNTSAAMLIGTGASLGTTGTGAITASALGALTGMPSQSAATVVANTTGSSAAPTAVSLASFQTAMIAANAQLVTATGVTGPTYDYNPSGFGATTAILYITPASGGSTYGGLAAGSAMQQVFIVNAEAAGGSDAIYLLNQSSSDSIAANRFLTSATSSLAIPPGGGVDCIYLASTIDRWWCH